MQFFIITLVTSLCLLTSNVSAQTVFKSALDIVTLSPKDLAKGSSQLELQLFSAKAVESLLEKDPLILEEFAVHQTSAPIATPILIALFHAVSNPATKLTNKVLVAKFGAEAVEAGGALEHVPSGAGLAVGALGMRLLIEWIGGDLHQYWRSNDIDPHAQAVDPKKHRAKLVESMFGLGAGFGASTALSSVGGGVLLGAGISNPIGWAALAVASGVTFFVTSDYYERYADKQALYGIEKKNLDHLLNTLPAQLVTDVRSCETNRNLFDGNVMLLNQSYAGERAALSSDFLDYEKRYLEKMIRFKTEAYQQTKLVGWVASGSQREDPEYRSNHYNWNQQVLPYNESIAIGLYPDSRKSIALEYIQKYKKFYVQALSTAQSKHESGRNAHYRELLDDSRFAGSYANELTHLINLILLYNETNKDLFLEARQIASGSGSLIARSADLAALLTSELHHFQLNVKSRMQSCEGQELELLLSDAAFFANEFQSFADHSHFSKVVDQSIDKISETLKNLQN